MQCRCEVAHQNSEHPLQVTLKAKDNQCDKFGIIAGTISCHIDNLWCHQGWQSYLINDHLFLIFCVRGNWVSWPICVTKMVVFALYIYHKYMWDDHIIFLMLMFNQSVKLPYSLMDYKVSTDLMKISIKESMHMDPATLCYTGLCQPYHNIIKHNPFHFN